MQLSGPQLRAARSLIDWNRDELAKAAKCSPETIKNIEHGIFRPQEETTDRIIKAFAAVDIVFTEDQGVKFTSKTVRLYHGAEGYAAFLNFICEEMKNGGNAYQLNYPDSVIKRFGGTAGKTYMDRMSKVPNFVAKCLVPEGDANFPAKYCQYKWLPKKHAESLSYYMFGDYVSLLSAVSEKEVVFIVIHAPALAQVLRDQFEIYWQNGIEISKSYLKSTK